MTLDHLDEKIIEGWLLHKVKSKDYATLVPLAVDDGEKRSLSYYIGYRNALLNLMKLVKLSNDDPNMKAISLMLGYATLQIKTLQPAIKRD